MYDISSISVLCLLQGPFETQRGHYITITGPFKIKNWNYHDMINELPAHCRIVMTTVFHIVIPTPKMVQKVKSGGIITTWNTIDFIQTIK